MARKRAPTTAKGPTLAFNAQKAPPLRRSMRSARSTQPIHDDADDEDGSIVVPKKLAKNKKTTSTQPQQVISDHSPSGPRYNTRSKQAQSSASDESVPSNDEEGVEELPIWPRYKDDLPNAFNGEVDPSQDFISNIPVEIIDNILSFVLLDHDPERGVKMKESNYKPRPHAIISMAAMSQLFYHATEGFAHKFLMKNRETLSTPRYFRYLPKDPELVQSITAHVEAADKAKKERDSRLRRSTRLANQPQLEPRKVYRVKLCRELRYVCAICLKFAEAPGKLANAVSICSSCESSINGPFMVCQVCSPAAWNSR